MARAAKAGADGPGWVCRIDDDKKYGGKGKIYNRNAFIFNVCFGQLLVCASGLKMDRG